MAHLPLWKSFIRLPLATTRVKMGPLFHSIYAQSSCQLNPQHIRKAHVNWIFIKSWILMRCNVQYNYSIITCESLLYDAHKGEFSSNKTTVPNKKQGSYSIVPIFYSWHLLNICWGMFHLTEIDGLRGRIKAYHKVSKVQKTDPNISQILIKNWTHYLPIIKHFAPILRFFGKISRK